MLLDRISQARAIKDGAVLHAIIDIMKEESASAENPGVFKSYLVNHSVCESLINAISVSETFAKTRHVDPRVVTKLYWKAHERGWELDSGVLQDAAMYLACSSCQVFCRDTQYLARALSNKSLKDKYETAPEIDVALVERSLDKGEYSLALDAVSVPNSELRGFANIVRSDLPSTEPITFAADELLETAIHAARTLHTRRVFPSDQLYYQALIWAMCSFERVDDAEWLLAQVRDADTKNLGPIFAAAMSMYYRLGEPAKAEALLDEFSGQWKDNWEKLASLVVMPDNTSLETECWRLTHEEGVQDAESRLILAEELQAIRTNAASPFYRRALELIRLRRVNDAMAALESARDTQFAAVSTAQLDTLVRALLVRGNIDQAYVLCMDFRHSKNTTGGRGITARDVVFVEAPSNAVVSSMLVELGKSDDWDRIWCLADSVNRQPSVGCMQTLLERALTSANLSQAVNCARRITAICNQDSSALAPLADSWIEGILGLTQKSINRTDLKATHPIVSISAALLHNDVSSHCVAFDKWNARVVKGAIDVAASVSASEAEEVRSGLYEALGHGGLTNDFGLERYLTKAHKFGNEEQPHALHPEAKDGYAKNEDQWETSTLDGAKLAELGEEITRNMPLLQKKRWYEECRRRGHIPPVNSFSWLVRDAIELNDRKFWEPVIRDHLPAYLAKLESHVDRRGKLYCRGFAVTIWSHAIFAYASVGEIEEAMVYFRRIVNVGEYPVSQSTAVLLNVLSSTELQLPIPVIPRGWDGPTYSVCGMEPVYPPRGESPSDTFIVPATTDERMNMVAEVGLAMYYASLRCRKWPSAYFTCVLLSSLARARRVKEMRNIFDEVIPRVSHAKPPRLRISPSFMQSPVMWLMAIRGAAKCGERALAEYWFKEYRMSAMPLFREEASAYSRFVFRTLPKYARLFSLGRPYYTIPRINRPLLDNDIVPTPWYDLQEVEVQLEMDRLRALDKLPLDYHGASRMLTIYTQVEEHQNMDSAEIIAEEIQALYKDQQVPKSARPRDAKDLATSWKKMVVGYINLLRRQQGELDLSCVNPSDVRRTQERLAFWFQKWRTAFEKTDVSPRASAYVHMALAPEEVQLAQTIWQNWNAASKHI
ncbi:hypothetical protein H4R20_000998 [Coemansia guatemalensis]|uniref:Uncharacterized protein n=1 Tax=Coemansia guatemalensis TaxID=2761395 RepID=A0A9W8I2R2_9FUNG|nr:hypothetical protein H4R20_000998 [Coemansia guatemalensis]